MIQGHGDDIYNYKNIKANFSSNVNPWGVHPDLLPHLCNCISSITSYPHPIAENLGNKISKLHDVSPESVLVSNGAVDAFYLIASLYSGARSLVYTPSFSEYEDACKAYNHIIDFRDNKSFTETEDYKHYDTVWIGNPNNPDGKMFPVESLKLLAQKFSNTIFVIDEAYIDFVKNAISLVQEVSQIRNIVVISSLTKKYVIPGLRLGYLIAHQDIINRIKSKLMPWRINTLAIEAGLFCLSKENKHTFKLDSWLKESKRLQGAINELDGFNVLSSETTFFLVKSPVKASLLKQELAFNYKILIRDASNFRGLTENHFRVSVRTFNENELLINALKEWN